jgi:DNA repair protein RadC
MGNGSRIDGVADVDLPREKLDRVGADALKSEELLAILLRTGYEGRNVLSVARRVLDQHPCDQLVRMTLGELVKIKGIGQAKASVLVAAFELARRAFDHDVGIAPTISAPRDILPLIADIKDHRKEHFLALFLNGRNQVIRREDVSIGSQSQTLVHPREVFAPAVGSSAAGVVLAHNHPSGEVNPSQNDVELTRRMVQAGEIMGIEVLDHVIISSTAFLSFKEMGML